MSDLYGHGRVSDFITDRDSAGAGHPTRDDARVEALADALECGTVFQNRCDFLDPELAWVGVKDSGHGISLSHLGLRALTRPKSLHFRRR